MNARKQLQTPYILIKRLIGKSSVFLSRLWVSKWHPKILQWHPKFWKPRYGFSLSWSKTIWRKHVFLHVALATDGCNVIMPTQFSGADVGSEIISTVSVHCHAHRLASACDYTAAYLYIRCTKLRMHFSAIMEVLYCFTVLFHRLAWPCIRLQWTQKFSSCSVRTKQGGCRVRQQWELSARFWLFGPHRSSCQKIKMMHCALFYCDFWKQKISTWCFRLSRSPHWAKFFRRGA